MSAYDDLEAMIARVRSVGALAEDVAREATPEIEQVAQKTAAAGGTPEGVRWAPTKSGSAPLQHAAGAISARVLGGSIIQLVVSGYHAIHHQGAKRRRIPKRQILPATLTPAISRALRDAAERVFLRRFQGA